MIASVWNRWLPRAFLLVACSCWGTAILSEYWGGVLGWVVPLFGSDASGFPRATVAEARLDLALIAVLSIGLMLVLTPSFVDHFSQRLEAMARLLLMGQVEVPDSRRGMAGAKRLIGTRLVGALVLATVGALVAFGYWR